MAKFAKGASIILVKGKKALLMLRDDKPDISYPNVWSLTGGGVEEGEPFKQAAIRELKEETGYVCTDPKFLMTSKYVNDYGVNITAKRYYDIYDEKQKLYCYEGQDLKFLSIKELKSLDVFPGHREAALKAIELANES